MILNIIKLSLILTLSIVGSFLVFGFLIGYIQGKTNINLLKTFGKKGIIATNFIGTTVHELSHYIMCIIFLHKVDKVKLFSFKLNESGVLGEVQHSYNKKSIYQRIGNFFIGVAPIFVGAIVLILSIRLLLPTAFIRILEGKTISNFLASLEFTTLAGYISSIIDVLRNCLKYIFTIENFTSIRFWIFIIIAFSVSTHMTLSKADLRNSKDGLITIFLLSILVSIILMLFYSYKSFIFRLLILFNSFLILILSIGLFFSILSFLISAVFTQIKK
jgi:hypothetical protein